MARIINENDTRFITITMKVLKSRYHFPKHGDCYCVEELETIIKELQQNEII